MAPRKIKKWYNLYKDGAGVYLETEELAKMSKDAPLYLATRSVEWEE